MKIIKPSATIMRHNTTPYQFIEKVGRTCYKSEDKITDNSAEQFVKGLINRKHFAMLEHETIYLVTSATFMEQFLDDMFERNEPLKYFTITHTYMYHIISGSFRAFYELLQNDYSSTPIEQIKEGLAFCFPTVFGDFAKDPYVQKHTGFMCQIYTRDMFIDCFKNLDTKVLFKHLTHTVKFVCDRGVSHEFVRHRPCAFAQESTRYCNYTKGKFDSEITVIEPFFFIPDGDRVSTENWSERYGAWISACKEAEKSYNRIIADGGTPQEARSVLPNSLKTELIITATEEEWQHIVNLRYLGTTGAPHPQIKEVMGHIVENLSAESEGRIKYEAD